MDEKTFEIILELVKLIIPVLGVIITAVLIPYIKTKIGTEKFEQYKKYTEIAVKAAEMLWTESGMGAEKKEFVVDFLNELFNKDKVVITEEQISVLIEACVKEMNAGK